MKIDKDLIEKYHQNLCSEKERLAVEEWLLNDEADEEVLLPQGNNKLEHKDEMWKAISIECVPQMEEVKSVSLNSKSKVFSYFIRIAAVIVLGLFISFFLFKFYSSDNNVVASKSVQTGSENIKTKTLEIILAPQSHANISESSNRQSGSIEFCGSIMINPKEDFELTFNGDCSKHAYAGETISLKKGQKYIAVNYSFNSESDLIIVNEQNLINLPPVLQREIMEKFNI